MHVSLHETEHLLFVTLLQLIVMIGAARLMNTVLRALGQPGVIGEILAGLMLGPSLFGYFFPQASHALFGAKASVPITIISQLGLILLMFQIGMDFQFAHLRDRRNTRTAILVAFSSITVPFLLGLLIGRLSAPHLAPGMDPVVYSLFFAVGLAITALPVLGRILREYGLTRTEIGVIAISAAAVNDVAGWIMLAGISALAAARFSGSGMLLQMGGLALFGAASWLVLRPLAAWLVSRQRLREGEVPPNLMAIVIVLLFGMGICTYQLGVFASFGGFVAGLMFHRFDSFVAAWQRQVGRFALVFFLPVFFSYTGLRTDVLGLTAWSDLQWLGLILAAAIAGKILPVYLGGRLCGFDRHRAWVLGSLMNTRGLVELIALNVGYDLGFIPQKVFTMLVAMAVLTTLMTGPLLKVLLPRTGHAIPLAVEA
ncbi:MAG TPA: cation:proton antiporter [Steroidobacteraceae bacterium]|nr:cation:proton antiporter [Steroidobacteraceae bacterium]